MSQEDKTNLLQNLALPLSENGDRSSSPLVHLDDLCLTFQYSPPSRVFGYESADLKPGGEDLYVTLENVEEYVDCIVDFCLNRGIRRQLDALYEGFNLVFPVERLGAFSPEEIRLMVCGDQQPHWTRQDLLTYTEPKLGFTRERYSLE